MESLLTIGAFSFAPAIEELARLNGYGDIDFPDDNSTIAMSSSDSEIAPGYIVRAKSAECRYVKLEEAAFLASELSSITMYSSVMTVTF